MLKLLFLNCFHNVPIFPQNWRFWVHFDHRETQLTPQPIGIKSTTLYLLLGKEISSHQIFFSKFQGESTLMHDNRQTDYHARPFFSYFSF